MYVFVYLPLYSFCFSTILFLTKSLYIVSHNITDCHDNENHLILDLCVTRRLVYVCAQIPMIVLYVFGIPIVAFIVLRNNRNELHEIETRRKYSFLYAVRVLRFIFICSGWLLHICTFSLHVWSLRVSL